MGWWREGINICKKMTQQRVPRWSALILSGASKHWQLTVFPTFVEPWFKLLSSDAQPILAFGPRSDPSGATNASGVFIDHGRALVSGNSHC